MPVLMNGFKYSLKSLPLRVCPVTFVDNVACEVRVIRTPLLQDCTQILNNDNVSETKSYSISTFKYSTCHTSTAKTLLKCIWLSLSMTKYSKPDLKMRHFNFALCSYC
jgi:hypothetical protein